MLEREGIAPVRAAVGADLGLVSLVRSGDSVSSDVYIVGFSANFAARCEKIANSWEFIVGEGFGHRINNPSMIGRHEQSPKRYASGDNQRAYSFFVYNWRPAVEPAASLAREFSGEPLEEVLAR